MANKNIRAIDLNLFKILIALSEEKNVTKAGEAVFLSQPAVSHALNRLRHIFNDELFIRTHKGMQPTSQCLALIEPVTAALQELDSVLQMGLEFDPSLAEAEFKLGMNDIFSSILALNLIKQVAAEAPNIQLNIIHTKGIDIPSSNTGVFADLDTGLIDLAVLQDYETPPRFERESLGAFDHVCIAAKNHPDLKNGLTLDKYQTLGHIFITGTHFRKATLGNALNEMGIIRDCRLKVPHFVTALNIAETSDLICTMPRFASEYATKRYDLQVFDLPFESPIKAIYQVWHKTLTKDPLHQWMRQSVKSSLSDSDLLFCSNISLSE